MVAFPELGTEALRRLVVRNFPAVVVIDSEGGDLYSSGRERFQRVFVHNCEV
jgi:fumarate hydratase subunit beta